MTAGVFNTSHPPTPPPYTLTRYDEDYSYLSNPANRTEPLDVIKYLPLFNWGPSCFVTLGSDLREQYEFIQNDNFGLGSVNNHGSNHVDMSEVFEH
jgi:hypothetical protein